VRLMVRGILPGGPRRWAAFMRTLPVLSPRKLPVVISDWITGLSMRAYAQRRFAPIGVDRSVLARHLRALRNVLAPYVQAGTAGFTREPGRMQLAIAFTGWPDLRFFARLAPRLERLLRHTPATLVLRIEQLHEKHLIPMQRLLARLARHGDRVSVVVHARLGGLVSVDSSVFNVVLAGGDS